MAVQLDDRVLRAQVPGPQPDEGHQRSALDGRGLLQGAELGLGVATCELIQVGVDPARIAGLVAVDDVHRILGLRARGRSCRSTAVRSRLSASRECAESSQVVTPDLQHAAGGGDHDRLVGSQGVDASLAVDLDRDRLSPVRDVGDIVASRPENGDLVGAGGQGEAALIVAHLAGVPVERADQRVGAARHADYVVACGRGDARRLRRRHGNQRRARYDRRGHGRGGDGRRLGRRGLRRLGRGLTRGRLRRRLGGRQGRPCGRLGQRGRGRSR